jgi:hypothetical protein
MRYPTLLIDPDTWDLVVDANGNIAVAEPPYALAQDVATAICLFKGEAWFDKTAGIPYFDETLGRRPPISILKARFEAAAMTVPGVVKANAVVGITPEGVVDGYVEFVDESGETSKIALS